MADWRQDVLRGLGAPITKQNMSFLTRWQAHEGGHTKNDARYNWLNTTRDAPGAIKSINSVGVKKFDTYENGIRATIDTLKQGYYTGIVEGLATGNPQRSGSAVRGLATWVAGPNAINSGVAYAGNVLGIGKQSAWQLMHGENDEPENPNTPTPSGKATGSSARVVKGGQTFGGGGDSPQQLAAASNAERLYQRSLAGFMLGRASARLRGETPQGGFLELAQLRDQYQAMGGVPEVRDTGPGAKPDAGTQIDGGSTKITPKMVKDGQDTSDVSQRILQAAHKQVGQPYVWGAESRGEGGFDCSGLIDYAYRQAGINLPGRLTTGSARTLGRSVKGQALRAGDMVISNNGKHMTMYVGDGKVIAAPRTGTNVQYQDLSRFSGDIVDIRRVIP